MEVLWFASYSGRMRALIYTRVSQDRAEGRSPAEQEAESRALCERNDWEVVQVCTDTRGASRHSKGARPGWDEALRLVASGGVDVLVTWEASRAQRDVAAYTVLRDLCAKHSVLWCYSGKVYDMTSGSDRFVSGLDALIAEREVEETRERIMRSVRANAAAGRPHGRRLYGYRRVYDPVTRVLVTQEPVPEEAEVVRSIFADYLAGVGIRTIAAGLAGIRTGTGADWTYMQVKRVLRNPHYAGRRVHRGEVVADATWEPLVSADDFETVQARLDDSRARHVRTKWTARLLSGVGRCGVCGSKVFAGHDRNQRKTYICKTRFCVTRDLRKLDAYVVSSLLDRLEEPGELADPPAPALEARKRAAELQARLDDAVAEFTSGRLSAGTLAKVEADLRPRIAQAEAEVRRAFLSGVDLDGKTPEVWWDGLTAEAKREAVNRLIEAVVIKRTKQGTREFLPDCVEVVFR